MTTDELQPSARKLIAPLWHTGLLLSIILALTLFGFYSQRNSSPAAEAAPPGGKVFLYLSIIALQYGLLRLIIGGLRRNGFNLGELIGERANNWRAVGFDVLIAAIFWAMCAAILEIIKRLLGGDDAHVGNLLPNGILESALWIVLSVAAGFVEEVCYRGYLQKQILALTGLAPVAIIGQAILFGISHSYQGFKSTIVITIYGGFFGLLAYWRNSLRPGIVAHALTDIIGGLLR